MIVTDDREIAIASNNCFILKSYFSNYCCFFFFNYPAHSTRGFVMLWKLRVNVLLYIYYASTRFENLSDIWHFNKNSVMYSICVFLNNHIAHGLLLWIPNISIPLESVPPLPSEFPFLILPVSISKFPTHFSRFPYV